MYLYRYPLITLINTTVILLINGCGMSSSSVDSSQGSLSNSQDKQCKQIIKAINQSSVPINKAALLPELPPLPELPEFTLDNQDLDNSPQPRRFNSRKDTGKTAQELQQEAYENAQQLREQQLQDLQEQSEQSQLEAKQAHERFLGYLDARIEQVQAVEIKDSQLKSLQNQLIQAYQQEREAMGIFTPYQTPLPPIEEPIDFSSEKMEEQMNQELQQMNQQVQQINDASSKVQMVNSSLNKYCGLE